MKIGLILDTQFTPEQNVADQLDLVLEQVRRCRDLGFSGVYCIHHYLSDPYQQPQLWPLLGRIAAEIGPDMRLGSSIFLLTIHNPVYTAEQVATLDLMTGGRFDFGVGLGYRKEEYRAFGVDHATRARRFDECLDLTRHLLEGKQVDHEGEFFSLAGARLSLLPVQRPHPPIWVAASNDAGVRRVARHGLPWLINPHATLSTLEQQVDLYQRELESNGFPSRSDLPLFREFGIARSRQEAVDRSRPYLESKYAKYATWGLDEGMPEHESLSAPFEVLARDRFVLGDPDDCIEQLAQYNDRLGVSLVLARVQWPGLPHEDALDAIELIGREILPVVRGWGEHVR